MRDWRVPLHERTVCPITWMISVLFYTGSVPHYTGSLCVPIHGRSVCPPYIVGNVPPYIVVIESPYIVFTEHTYISTSVLLHQWSVCPFTLMIRVLTYISGHCVPPYNVGLGAP